MAKLSLNIWNDVIPSISIRSIILLDLAKAPLQCSSHASGNVVNVEDVCARFCGITRLCSLNPLAANLRVHGFVRDIYVAVVEDEFSSSYIPSPKSIFL